LTDWLEGRIARRYAKVEARGPLRAPFPERELAMSSRTIPIPLAFLAPLAAGERADESAIVKPRPKAS
jgi:hypothetical protein